jgi:hypothetical protein
LVYLSLTALVLVGPAWADDLTGVQKFLCSATTASACCDDGQCASGTAMEVNVPQFIEIDLAAKRVSTTKASGMNRTSPIESMKREDGQILIHGDDSGRAYSFVIVEHTGELSAAIAAAGCNVSVFGACTPMPAAK